MCQGKELQKVGLIEMFNVRQRKNSFLSEGEEQISHILGNLSHGQVLNLLLPPIPTPKLVPLSPQVKGEIP